MKYTSIEEVLRAFDVAVDQHQLEKIRQGRSYEANSFSGIDRSGGSVEENVFYSVSFVVKSYGFRDQDTKYELRMHLSNTQDTTEDWTIRFHGHQDYGFTVDRIDQRLRDPDHVNSPYPEMNYIWTRYRDIRSIRDKFNAVVFGAAERKRHEKLTMVTLLDENNFFDMAARVMEFDRQWRGYMYEKGEVGLDRRPKTAHQTPKRPALSGR